MTWPKSSAFLLVYKVWLALLGPSDYVSCKPMMSYDSAADENGAIRRVVQWNLLGVSKNFDD